MVGGLEIKGIKQLRRNAKWLFEEMADSSRKYLVNEGRRLSTIMRNKAPKDKMNLANAIVSKTWRDKRGVIGIVVGITHESNREHPEFSGTIKKPKGKRKTYYYPAAQEYGWSAHGKDNPGTPYVRPTFDENSGRINTMIETIFKSKLNKVKPK
jgi:hypothetical protein